MKHLIKWVTVVLLLLGTTSSYAAPSNRASEYDPACDEPGDVGGGELGLGPRGLSVGVQSCVKREPNPSEPYCGDFYGPGSIIGGHYGQCSRLPEVCVETCFLFLYRSVREQDSGVL